MCSALFPGAYVLCSFLAVGHTWRSRHWTLALSLELGWQSRSDHPPSHHKPRAPPPPSQFCPPPPPRQPSEPTLLMPTRLGVMTFL